MTTTRVSTSAQALQRRRIALVLIAAGCVAVLVGSLLAAIWIHDQHRRARDAATLEAELASLRPSSTPIFPFHPDQDFEPLLTALAASPGSAPSPEQVEAPLWDLHESVVTHVARRLGLSEEARRIALERAHDRHAAMVALYSQEFRETISRKTAVPDSETVFSFRLAGAARDFSRLLSKRLCGFTLSALNAELEVPGAKAVLALPCELILSEVLMPLTEEMESQGLLLDHVQGREAIRNQLQRAILELGTAEARFEDRLSLEYSKTIVFDWAVSRGNLEVSARPTVKAGFDLLQLLSYQVDGARQELVVTLPPPKILSVSPDLQIDQLQEGLFVNIDKTKINEAIGSIEQRARQRAIETGLLEDARSNARAAVRQLLLPLAQSPLGTYGVRVEFAEEREKLVVHGPEG